jgi:hypothetical protein
LPGTWASVERLCGGSSAKPWSDRLVADVAAYPADIKASKHDQLRATGLPQIFRRLRLQPRVALRRGRRLNGV